MSLGGRQADVPIDARDIVVAQTTKLNMDCKPRPGIPKKETQDLVRRPAKGLELAVNVLKESIVVAAKAQVMVAAKCIGQAFACPDLPTVLISERGGIALVAQLFHDHELSFGLAKRAYCVVAVLAQT